MGSTYNSLDDDWLEEQLAAALIASSLVSPIDKALKDSNVVEKLVEKREFSILKEIQQVLYKHDTLNDFEIVEKIVLVFEKYDIATGGCHKVD